MAVVGEAHIVVRAITNQVRDDIRNGLKDVDKEFEKTGRDSGSKLSDAFKKSSGGGKGGGLFDGLKKEAEAARQKLSGLITTGYAVGPAIVGIVGAVGAAGAGLFALGAQAASAAPALLSLLNVFTAVAQGAAVLKMAFAGIGAAISAGGKQAGKAAQDNSKQIEAAEKRVDQSRKRVAQAKAQAAEMVKNAVDRYNASLDRQRDADEAVTEAQLDEVEAANAVAEAKSKISEAIDEATESLQQLRFELEQTVLSEQRAVLGFEDARENLAKVANLPPNNRQRREAELAFAEAELSLRRAKDNTLDTQKEVDKANEKGIEGSDQVIAAKKRVTDAEKAEINAKKATTNALKAQTQAQQDSTDALQEWGATTLRAYAQVSEAEDALTEAQDALKELKNGTKDAGGGVDKFAEAMAKLAPAGQSFVMMILGMKDQFTELKKSVQQEFFSRINDDVKALADTYLPLLEKRLPETSAVLAGVAEKLMGVFNDPENVAAVDRIFGSNTRIIGDLGTAVSNLASIFIDLLDAAAPLAEKLATWVKNLTEGWKETVEADKKSGDLKTTLDNAAGVVSVLAGLFGDLFGTIKNIGVAAAGPGSGGALLLGWLREAVAGWEAFTGSVKGQNELTKFFKDVAPVAKEIFGLIGDLGGAFFETTKAAVTGSTEIVDGKYVPKDSPLLAFFKSLREAFGFIADMGPDLLTVLPIIGEGFVSVAKAIGALTSSGAIETFFTVLKDAAGVVADIVSSPLFLQIFAIVAPVFALSRGLSLVFSLMKFIFLGALVGPIMSFIGMFSKLRGIFWQVRAAIQTIGLAFGVGSGPVLAFIAILAGLVLIFVAMWRESEVFRKAIKDLVDKVIAKAIEIFEKLKKKVEEALEPLGGAEGVINGLKTAFKFLGDIVGTYVVPIIEDYLMVAFEVIGAIIGTIIDTIGNLIKAFKDIITGIQEGDLGKVFSGIWGVITAGITAFLNTILGFFGTSLGEIWDKVKQWVIDLGTTISELPGKVGEWLAGLWDSIWTFLEEQWNRVVAFYGPGGIVATFLRELPGKVGGWLKGIWNSLLTYLEEKWNLTVEWYGPNGVIATFLKGLPAKVGGWLTGLWNSLYTFLDEKWKEISTFFTVTVLKYVTDLPGEFRDALSGLWDGLLSGLKTAWKSVSDWWNNNVALAWTIDVPDWTGISDYSIKIPSLPNFADGGTVFPSAGGTLARVAEAGRAERIEPLDPDGLSKRDKAMISYLGGGGGGATINVYPSAGMNERELAQMVSKELAYMMRKGAV